MLLYCGLGIIIVGLLILLVALWFGRIQSGRLFFAAGGTILLVGVVVTQLFDVQKLVFKSGENEAYSFELQRVERAAQQIQADTAEVRQMKEQIEALVKRLEKSKQTVAKVQGVVKEWSLSAEQKQFLVQALSPFRGQKVKVSCIKGDVKGCQFAKEFISVFVGAGWNLGGENPGVSQATYSTVYDGIQVTVSPKDNAAGSVPLATEILITSLEQLGLSKHDGFMDEAVEAGSIDLRVGGKPSPS